jgi:TPR repeat protein
MAISVFGTEFLVVFGVGFLTLRPHGIRGVLWLAVGVIATFAVGIALGEAGSFLGRKLREWRERMERASSALGEKGDAQTQYDLGNSYYQGEHGPQDYAQAAYWWRKAAEQGHAQAQLELGHLYCDGKGVPQDYTQAAFWYREAAEQGHVPAQYVLGGLCDGKGQGEPQAYVEAYFWYALAASKLAPLLAGSSLAKGPAEHRDEAASHLTPADLSRVQERVRKWFEDHPAKPQ